MDEKNEKKVFHFPTVADVEEREWGMEGMKDRGKWESQDKDGVYTVNI